jgi:hypothetical protein
MSHTLHHISHHSTDGCSHSIEVQTMPACLEAIQNNTWNVWILQEIRLPFYFPPFDFHCNVLHHFLLHSSDLTNLLEHFDSSNIITVNQRHELDSLGRVDFASDVKVMHNK